MNRLLHWKGWLFIGLLLIPVALYVQSYSSRIDNWHALTRNCLTVTVPASIDGASRDADLHTFANRAAEARRADGDYNVARDYAKIAERAQARAERSKERASVSCKERFPKPSLVK